MPCNSTKELFFCSATAGAAGTISFFRPSSIWVYDASSFSPSAVSGSSFPRVSTADAVTHKNRQPIMSEALARCDDPRGFVPVVNADLHHERTRPPPPAPRLSERKRFALLSLFSGAPRVGRLFVEESWPHWDKPSGDRQLQAWGKPSGDRQLQAWGKPSGDRQLQARDKPSGDRRFPNLFHAYRFTT